MGRRQEQGEVKSKRTEGTIIGLHHCDGHTAVTCCWRDSVAPPSTTKKMARKLVMEPVIHKTHQASLSQSGTLFTKAYTYANQRRTVHTIYTHRNTLIHTDTRVVREITVVKCRRNIWQ